MYKNSLPLPSSSALKWAPALAAGLLSAFGYSLFLVLG